MGKSKDYTQFIGNGAIKTVATLFGVGYLPYCPGTLASLASLALYGMVLKDRGILFLCALLLFVLGSVVCTKAERLFGKKDASVIVIDEAAALLLLLSVIPRDTRIVVVAFVLFRVFDILKPYPIKKIEKFSGSWGIMVDDLIAALYAFICIGAGASILSMVRR